MMENKDGFPVRIDLFPKLTKVANFIKRLLPKPEIPNRGASECLDDELYGENN